MLCSCTGRNHKKHINSGTHKNMQHFLMSFHCKNWDAKERKSDFKRNHKTIADSRIKLHIFSLICECDDSLFDCQVMSSPLHAQIISASIEWKLIDFCTCERVALKNWITKRWRRDRSKTDETSKTLITNYFNIASKVIIKMPQKKRNHLNTLLLPWSYYK